MFDRIEVMPAYRTVCEAIEKEIVAGRLGPGEQLPTETALAAQFGLTRHTVREGLRLLEESGLVVREAGRRLFVRQPHYKEQAQRSLRALVMQRVTFNELWEVTMALEPLTAAGAAERASSQQINALEDNLSRMENAFGKGQSIIALDLEFHTLIAEIAANKALLLSREPISQLFYPALERLFRHPENRFKGPRRLMDAHRKIIDALKQHDAIQAEAWMRRHIADFRRGYDLCGFAVDEEVGTAAATKRAN